MIHVFIIQNIDYLIHLNKHTISAGKQTFKLHGRWRFIMIIRPTLKISWFTIGQFIRLEIRAHNFIIV